jgi:hypothetical protein
MNIPLLSGLVRKLQLASKAVLLCVFVVFGLLACESTPKSSESSAKTPEPMIDIVVPEFPDEIHQASNESNPAAPSAEDTSPTSPSPAPSEASSGPKYSPATDGTLPAQYRVQNNDSFKRIAARPEIYGDESLWRTLYNANRNLLPNPDDPGLIVTDIVLTIPSIQGETREGLWEEGGKYPTLNRVVAASIPPDSFPAKYRVRPWAVSQDTFSSIAGRSWAYNDSSKWIGIYDANRAKLPDPNNPDRLMPGIELDIPSIQGETRVGLWNEEHTYPVFTPSGR